MENDATPQAAHPVSYAALRDQVHMVFPNDLNANDTVFGGLVMSLMDRYAVVCAERHAGVTCVTVGVDAVHFIAPAGRGDVLIYNVSVNKAWSTSMEIGVRVEAACVGGGERRHILSAYLTFVAMADGKPHPVPDVTPETDIEQQRCEEAEMRRALRLRHAQDLKEIRAKRKRGDC